MYYKDYCVYIFRLIHIYIYFNILLSYLNSAHSAILLSRMIRCLVSVERIRERERVMHFLEAQQLFNQGSWLTRNYVLYKDNGRYVFRLIHIYIYFNILLSYLNAAHSAVLVSRMTRC